MLMQSGIFLVNIFFFVSLSTEISFFLLVLKSVFILQATSRAVRSSGFEREGGALRSHVEQMRWMKPMQDVDGYCLNPFMPLAFLENRK